MTDRAGETELLARLFRVFGATQCRGRSPVYERLSEQIATDAALLEALAGQNFASAPADVRAELLDFYSQPEAPYATKGNPKAWAKVQVELQQLKQAPPPVLSTTTAVPVASGNQ